MLFSLLGLCFSNVTEAQHSGKDMLLLSITVFSLLIGLSAEIDQREACYGDIFTIPFEYTPPLFNGTLYLTPTSGRRRVLIENKQAKDPRIKIGPFRAVLERLSSRDEGTFSVSVGGGYRRDVIRLKIHDCTSDTTMSYGDKVKWNIHGTEYIEFAQNERKDLTQVVWNRTAPQTHTRGKVLGSYWEMRHVTPADQGSYDFRKKDLSLLSRKTLTVNEHILDLEKNENEHLIMVFPTAFSLGRVTFIPSETSEPETLRKRGVDPEDGWLGGRFEGRLFAGPDDIVIDPVISTDSGTFEFRDQDGHLVLCVYLEVNAVIPTYGYIGVGVGIISVVIICCCCMRKCCCKKSSSKRSEPDPQSAEASTTNYYADRPPAVMPYSAVPSSSSSYQPVNPHVSVEPATTSRGPQAAAIGGQEGATVAGGQGSSVAAPSFNIDCPSADPAPTFELKGLHFLSASPLNSGSTSAAEVYNSEKLNFL